MGEHREDTLDDGSLVERLFDVRASRLAEPCGQRTIGDQPLYMTRQYVRRRRQETGFFVTDDI